VSRSSRSDVGDVAKWRADESVPSWAAAAGVERAGGACCCCCDEAAAATCERSVDAMSLFDRVFVAGGAGLADEAALAGAGGVNIRSICGRSDWPKGVERNCAGRSAESSMGRQRGRVCKVVGHWRGKTHLRSRRVSLRLSGRRRRRL
jgi:hypothetical protein